MSQPLVGNITTKRDRSQVIGVNSGLFYAACLVSLVTISLLLKFRDELAMLTGIVVVGATLGLTASRFINRIDETESIREAARQPIRSEFRAVLRDRVMMRQLAAGFAINLGLLMLVPISMLALKRGYGVSDTRALLFALAQLGMAAVASFLSRKIDARFGSRRTLLYAFLLLVAIGPVWMLAPSGFHPFYLLLPFLCAGATNVITLNATMHYFLQTVPERRQVAGSMFIWVVNGAGAGLVGMVLAGALLNLSARFNPADSLLPGYRIYFGLASLLLTGGVWLILRLPLLPGEERQGPEHHLDEGRKALP